ncbi:hypothetical protein [Streptomyces sp. 184]|uniref:hypothetical protein n=1 Tax=Streptomyces sp. 184 TaxID=1827526 RepID=UPI00389251B4
MPNHPSIIARPRGANGFEGRYVHNDGHPAIRVPLLHALHAGPFTGDVDAMTRFLIDEHPAGWSQLGPGPAADTGWINPMPPIGDRNFRCYCHGDRAETPLTLTDETEDVVHLHDWVFVLRPAGVDIWQSFDGVWLRHGVLLWQAPTPRPMPDENEAA